MAGLAGLVTAPSDAKKRKKRKKRKKKRKCGKAGGKPVKGKCCGRAVAVDGVCRACDVCASGCAFTSVQAAVDAANTGDRIAICAGTFPVSRGIFVNKDLTIGGAGQGTDPGKNTILQGAVTNEALLTIGGQVVIQNLRITGGKGVDGGALFNTFGSLELIRCAFSGNGTPTSFGGAIFNDSDLTMTECTISDNTARSGGGIYNVRTLILVDSEIVGNDAMRHGGGIYNDSSTGAGIVRFDAASRVTANTAEDGGGIYNSGGSVTLVSSANVTNNDPNNCAGTAAIPRCLND